MNKVTIYLQYFFKWRIYIPKIYNSKTSDGKIEYQILSYFKLKKFTT